MSADDERAGEDDVDSAAGGRDGASRAPQPGLLGVMFFAVAGGLALVLGVVAVIGYLLMR